MFFDQLLKTTPDAFRVFSAILETLWPFLAFLVLFPLFKSTWLFWRQAKFKKGIKWVLLELRIPREIKKSPQAMEQVLAAIHTLGNFPSDFEEWYWNGEVTAWFSLEMVSFGGDVHMYIRSTLNNKGLVEAAFFSYYPDVEIVEVDDYVQKFPSTVDEMYEQGYNLWGTEMLLANKDAYPIKSYHAFEAPEEERQFDPASVFLEVLGKLKKEEMVGFQILIAPALNDWVHEWEHLVEKLKRPEGKKAPSGEGADLSAFVMRSPGETDVLKAIENNLSKPAFDTLIRFIYLSPKSMFYDSYARKGLVGAFNQYGSSDLNSFRQNWKVSTLTKIWKSPYLFPKTRNEYRKKRLLYTYNNRYIPPKTIMGRAITSHFFNWNFHSKRFKMTTESLATVFHPPTFLVLTAPHMKRVESRKTSPPAGLAIFGDEADITKYQ